MGAEMLKVVAINFTVLHYSNGFERLGFVNVGFANIVALFLRELASKPNALGDTKIVLLANTTA